jgi:hypothetical protein
MTYSDLHETQYERNEMAHDKEIKNENFEIRSDEQVEYCSCCGVEMTPIEVLESYLDQGIEQALEICGALRVEYDNANQVELLAQIADSLVQAASLTEIARDITDGENDGQ